MEKCNKSFDSICRVCLKQNRVESMVSLQGKPGRRSLITYGKVLMRFAKISIDYDDILPTKICQNCKKMIQNINAFKLMCKNNDRKLRKCAKMADNDIEKYKEMVCEYSLFSQYFPSGFRNIGPTTAPEDTGDIKTTPQESPADLKSEQNDDESDYDYTYNIPFDEKQIEPSNDSENVDSFLDSIENVVNTQIKVTAQHKSSENIDSFLDSIEKVVSARAKYSNMKTKPRPPPQGPANNFHCDICDRTLSNRFSFNYHMQRHTKYLFICDQCGRGFPGKVPLHRHLVKNHDTGPYIQCKSCPFKCSRRFDLNEHERIHTGERPFTCEKCGLTFRRRAIWRNHLIQHMEKNIPCTVCNKKFHRQSELTWHINSCHIRSFLFLCKVCNASYASNKTVRKHMLSKHGIPREKQGKILRVTKDAHIPFWQNKNDNAFLVFP